MVIMGMIYYNIFKFSDRFHDYILGNGDYVFFVTFIMVTMIAFINVVLSSPIHSSLFWISLGHCNQSIKRTIYLHPLGKL